MIGSIQWVNMLEPISPESHDTAAPTLLRVLNLLRWMLLMVFRVPKLIQLFLLFQLPLQMGKGREGPDHCLTSSRPPRQKKHVTGSHTCHISDGADGV